MIFILFLFCIRKIYLIDIRIFDYDYFHFLLPAITSNSLSMILEYKFSYLSYEELFSIWV